MTDETLPEVQVFPEVMRRTIELVGNAIPRDTLRKIAEVFNCLRWDFQDYGIQIYFLLNDAGEVSFTTHCEDPVDSVIAMDADTFHQAAHGKGNLGTALLMGKLRIEGISTLSLSKFTPLLKPFLDSYRQACAEFHDPGI